MACRVGLGSFSCAPGRSAPPHARRAAARARRGRAAGRGLAGAASWAHAARCTSEVAKTSFPRRLFSKALDQTSGDRGSARRNRSPGASLSHRLPTEVRHLPRPLRPIQQGPGQRRPRRRGARLLLHERRRAGDAVLLQDAQDGPARRREQRARDARGRRRDRARVLAAQLLDQLRELRAQLRARAAARQHLCARARGLARACAAGAPSGSGARPPRAGSGAAAGAHAPFPRMSAAARGGWSAHARSASAQGDPRVIPLTRGAGRGPHASERHMLSEAAQAPAEARAPRHPSQVVASAPAAGEGSDAPPGGAGPPAQRFSVCSVCGTTASSRRSELSSTASCGSTVSRPAPAAATAGAHRQRLGDLRQCRGWPRRALLPACAGTGCQQPARAGRTCRHMR
jgi:hypothetical protein